MKSLEIEAIDYIISWIENVGLTYDMEVSCYEESFKKIKKDLEVLEILRKYVYYIDHTIKLKSISKSVYNFDYEKLKQWLEEKII